MRNWFNIFIEKLSLTSLNKKLLKENKKLLKENKKLKKELKAACWCGSLMPPDKCKGCLLLDKLYETSN